MYQFPKFTPTWNSTCFGQFLCPSSGIYSLYIRHWYMSYRFEDSFRAGPGWNILVLLESCHKPVWHIPLLSEQWINSWWWTEEISETCRVSWQNKFVKLVRLVGFITKKTCQSFALWQLNYEPTENFFVIIPYVLLQLLSRKPLEHDALFVKKVHWPC